MVIALLAGGALVLIFLVLSLIHFYWVLGGRWGLAAAVPTKADGQLLFKAGWLPTLVVALGLLLLAAVIAALMGLMPLGWLYNLPDGFLEYGLWAVAGLFLLRAIGDFRYAGFFKRVRGTAFGRMDTLLFSPLCAVVAGLLALLLSASM